MSDEATLSTDLEVLALDAEEPESDRVQVHGVHYHVYMPNVDVEQPLD